MSKHARYRQRLKARARALFGSRCRGCHRDELELHLAHVRPTRLKGPGRGLSQRYLDALQHPECYTVLCEDCHAAFDGPFFRNRWAQKRA